MHAYSEAQSVPDISGMQKIRLVKAYFVAKNGAMIPLPEFPLYVYMVFRSLTGDDTDSRLCLCFVRPDKANHQCIYSVLSDTVSGWVGTCFPWEITLYFHLKPGGETLTVGRGFLNINEPMVFGNIGGLISELISRKYFSETPLSLEEDCMTAAVPGGSSQEYMKALCSLHW